MRALTRREFLRISTVTAASTIVASCAPGVSTPEPTAVPATPPATPPPGAPETPPSRYGEAPELADLVANGELPPVDERLPANPLVIDVHEEIGQYGGNWRRAYKGLADRWGPCKLNEEHGVEWRMEPGGVPRIVNHFFESYEVSEDGKEFTFHMRQGVRWSDGEEVDTEDVQFWYDYIFMDETLTPVKPQWLAPEGEPMALTVLDKHTFRVSFTVPAAIFIITMTKTRTGPNPPCLPSFTAPEHYLSKFHPALTPMEEIESVLKEHELATWEQLWDQGPIAFWLLNPEMPILSAWRIKISPLENQERIIMERNPYFWQVDPEGNQLPYIDTISHDYFDNDEVLVFKILNGEIDCQERHVNFANFTLFKENEESGGYVIKRWITAATNAYYPNICHTDPKLSELFNDVRFRHALSVAINREEINAVLHNGMLTPRQASPVSASPNFDPEYSAKWVEYDPDTANALLDEIGLTNRDAEGYRTWPDGSPMAFDIDHTHTGYPGGADEVELIIRYWGDVGLKFVSKFEDRTLYEERGDANVREFWSWPADRNSIVLADPGHYIRVGDQWWDWRESGGQQGVEPPPGHPCWDVWDLWDRTTAAPDEETRDALFKQLLDIHKENVWRIGTVGEFPALVITSTKMGNVPEGLIVDDVFRGKGLAQPAQFFFRA